ncbi:transposase [Candidatus Atribacteria bacterium 1244-E10-H5-B2]|nr:MAG: transposase [Candidatus Atribacteria bacterium 1244-E10-H5-B2]
MLKTYKYRVFPTKKQITIMNQWLFECRWLYNHFLEERKNSYEQENKSLNYYSQAISIVKLKKGRPELNNIHSQVLQNVAIRIDLAFKAFFRRVKAKEKPGYPRFKGFDRYDSFTFPQTGFRIINNMIKLSKIGSIKVKFHRPIEGTIKTCTIRKQADKWYICISVDYEPKPLRKSNKAVGIDVGLETFATLSTKEKVANPRFFKTDEKALTKAQRKLSKEEKGSLKRKNVKKVVIRIYERISNRRHNFTHQEARKIINKFGIICIEKLKVKNMMSNHTKVFGHKLNKSIADVAWSQFAQQLFFKAEDAGRKIIAIDPRGTSQRCSQCGIMVKKDLSTRWHKCPVCGLHIHRDLNASYNILALGMQSLAH